ncbi:MAG: DNA recombination protein RmuC [Thermodesulfobacteriota bacterium]
MQNIIYLQQGNPYLFPILLLLAVLGLTFFALYTIRKNKLIKLLNSDLLNIEYRDKELEEKVDTLSSELNISRESVMELTADKRGLETLLEKERELTNEKLAVLEEAKEKLSLEFQNLGNKIFEDKSKQFATQNKENIEGLLNPLREQIKDFDKKVSDTYEKETRERVSLLTQIEQLKNLNEKISQDAVNLANALKADTKTQGTWGEFVLEKVLEMSGLEKGREFETQETFRNDEGKMLRPDVIVHLPDGKDVVIDSKVSLTSYERYSSHEHENDKREALKTHVQSLNSHIRELSEKKYEELTQINTLNYVLMFIPIEAAYLVALEEDKELLKRAFDKNIIIVCPSTLLSTLRTIQSIWQFEHQNRNAQKIADEAGKMYDRFVDFIGHVDNIGSRLNQATNSYESAVKTLSEGRGNLVKKAEDMRKLGIKNKKSIPREFISDDSDEKDNEPKQEEPIKFPYNT